MTGQWHRMEDSWRHFVSKINLQSRFYFVLGPWLPMNPTNYWNLYLRAASRYLVLHYPFTSCNQIIINVTTSKQESHTAQSNTTMVPLRSNRIVFHTFPIPGGCLLLYLAGTWGTALRCSRVGIPVVRRGFASSELLSSLPRFEAIRTQNQACSDCRIP